MLCPEKVKVSNLIFPWSQYIAFIVLDKILWNILSYTFFLSAFIAFQLVRELKQTAATTVVRTLANIVFPFRIESCRGIFSMSLFAIGIPNMSIQFRFSLVKCYLFFFLTRRFGGQQRPFHTALKTDWRIIRVGSVFFRWSRYQCIWRFEQQWFPRQPTQKFG